MVIAIAGILTAVAIPAMSNFLRNSRITGAANDVMGALHFTRSEAIKRRQAVTLCTSANTLNADNSQNDNPTCAASNVLTGWFVFVDLNQSGTREAGEDILTQREPINTEITAVASADQFAVTYLMNGFALDPNASQLVLCDERGNTPSGGELSSARGILVAVTGRAGVTRDMDEIQELIDTIDETIGGCEPS